MATRIGKTEAACLLLGGLGLLLFLGYRYAWKTDRARPVIEKAVERVKMQAVRLVSGVESRQVRTVEAIAVSPTPVAHEYTVEALIGKEYLPRLREALRRSENFIKVAMFIISMGEGREHPVNALVEELVSARRRGVAVTVILEYPWGKKAPELKAKNENAIRYLKRFGVDAAFDEPRHCLHDKLVIIDDKVIFVGNHNWTREALTIHDEVSVCIRADPPDPQFRRYFDYISRLGAGETEEGKKDNLKLLQEELMKRSQDLSE